jgi:hypothetical protein
MSDVQINFKATDQTSSAVQSLEGRLASLRSRVQGMKDQVEEQATANERMGASFGDIAQWAAAAAGAMVVVRKLFDWGAEGATVLQTSESFGILMQKVGAAPALLEQLRAASRGTIDDMALMNSTSLLLAGTSGQLGKALADSAPRLMDIAKAAQKLNPQLGDTTYMYDSLARGIKRSSPLILDNLGLIIKVGDANKAYAESIGKNVTELTAEEKKIALLNDVLAKGAIMIDQAGGSTDSMTDSVGRMNTALANAGNTMKSVFAPIAINAANAITLIITASDQLTNALTGHEAEVRRTSGTYDDYIAEMVRAGTASGRLNTYQYNLAVQYGNTAMAARLLEEATGAVSEEYYNAVRAGYAVEEYEKRLRGNTLEVAGAMNHLQGAMADATGASDELAAANAGLATSLGNISAASLAKTAIDALNQSYATGAMTESDYIKGMFRVGQEWLGLPGKQIEASIALAKLKKDYDDGKISAEEYQKQISMIGRNIAAIPKETDVYLNIHISQDLANSNINLNNGWTDPNGPGKTKRKGGSGGSMMASGGSFDVSNRGGSSATDQSLVAFWATPGEHVEISPPGTRRSGGGGGDIYITGPIYGVDPDQIARALAREIHLQGVD